MNILPLKAQLQQVVSIFESRELIPSNRNAEMQVDSRLGVFVVQGPTAISIKRLVVLVPNVDMNEVQIAREVWEMASPAKLAVILLSMCNDILEEMCIQRRLITMAALIRDPRVTVEMHIEYGRDWLRGVKSVLTEGDVILCHEEQYVGFRQKPLANVLSALHVPVWTMSGFHLPNFAPRPRWLSTIIFWSVAAAILAGFFYLQIQINNLQDDLSKNVILCMSALVEIGSLYTWNSFFS